MKPTLRVHFSDEHPNRPGLWLSRRKNFIGVLQVDASDIDRDKRESNWLDGEWGAELELVGRDMVPMDRKSLQQHLDTLIANADKNSKTDVRDALQDLRVKILGSALELPSAVPPMPEAPSDTERPG